jgi:hypothetical protein
MKSVAFTREGSAEAHDTDFRRRQHVASTLAGANNVRATSGIEDITCILRRPQSWRKSASGM